MNKLKQTIIKELEDYKILLRSIPSTVMVLFVMSVILMNLLANRELVNLSWIALDCGFLLSWLSFLCMDIITKRFGAKAAIKLSIISVLANLIVCAIFFVVTKIPGNWGAYYDSNSSIANQALDATFGGTWYVLLGSTVAFLVSAAMNALINSGLGKLFKSNSFKVFALRSYMSTAIGQFIDNLIFALVVSYVFFGWTLTQVIVCSIAGAIMELLSEVIFSPIGFKVCKSWEQEGVGKDYINYKNEEDIHV